MGGINTVKLSKLRNFLRHYDFIETSQKGSHLIFTRQGIGLSDSSGSTRKRS
jgi:predicted RNA binding protein YcfA (HicA-like mRNA interferase family)